MVGADTLSRSTLRRAAWLQAVDAKRIWGLLVLLLTCLCVVHALTLLTSPTLWTDEALITDEGRLYLFNPHSSWSVNWWVSEDRPVLIWSYIGPIMQELAFRITAPLPVAPRLVSIFSAVLAAMAAMAWLLARGTARWVALLLSLALFMDPIFVAVYRAGRVDSLAVALGLTACWLIRDAGRQPRASRGRQWRLILAGMAAALAPFVWADAVMMLPLIFAELTQVHIELATSTPGHVRVGTIAAPFVMGGLAAGLIALVPIASVVSAVLAVTPSVVNGDAAPKGSHMYIGDFLILWVRSPLLPVLALTGALVRGNRVLAVATALVALYLLTRPANSAHIVYLLPYLVGLASGALTAAQSRGALYRAGVATLVAIVIWAFTASMVLRTVSALEQSAQRDPNRVFAAARAFIGPGPAKLWLVDLAFYYPGRSLGWHMYENHWFLQRPATLRSFWRRMDYVVVPDGEVTPSVVQGMKQDGFAHHAILLGKPAGPGHSLIARFVARFSGESGYGPDIIFARRPLTERIGSPK